MFLDWLDDENLNKESTKKSSFDTCLEVSNFRFDRSIGWLQWVKRIFLFVLRLGQLKCLGFWGKVKRMWKRRQREKGYKILRGKIEFWKGRRNTKISESKKLKKRIWILNFEFKFWVKFVLQLNWMLKEKWEIASDYLLVQWFVLFHIWGIERKVLNVKEGEAPPFSSLQLLFIKRCWKVLHLECLTCFSLGIMLFTQQFFLVPNWNDNFPLLELTHTNVNYVWLNSRRVSLVTLVLISAWVNSRWLQFCVS